MAATEADDFMRVSRVLTGHTDLDKTTGARLVQGFRRAAPETYAHLAALSALVPVDVSAHLGLEKATAGGLRPVALAVVAAWYTGTVGQGPGAVTVSYRDALMQRTVADALSPPTYAKGGPSWWTEPPPDAEEGAPAERADATSKSRGRR